MNLLNSITLWIFITQFLFLSCNLLIKEETPALQNISNSIDNIPTDEILQNILERLKLPTINSNDNQIQIIFTQKSYSYTLPFDVDQSYSDFVIATDIMAMPIERSFRYSIVRNGSNDFSIDENTGTLTVRTIISTPSFYFIILPCSDHSFNVQATDIDSGQTTEATIEISFTTDPMWSEDTSCDNDYSPEFETTHLNISIASNTSLHLFSSFYSVYAEDQDQGDSLTYSLSGSDASFFSIDDTNAVLSYINSSDIIDQRNFSLEVNVRDDARNTATRTVTVQVGESYKLPIDIFVIRESVQMYTCNGNCNSSSNSSTIKNYILNELKSANLAYNNFVDFNQDVRIQFVKPPNDYSPSNSSATLAPTTYYGDSAVTYRSSYFLTPTNADGTVNGAPPFQINYSSSRIPIILTSRVQKINTLPTSTTTRCAYNVKRFCSSPPCSFPYPELIGESLIVIGEHSTPGRCNLSELFAHELGHFYSLLHSFQEESCMTENRGTTERIMDYSMLRTTFVKCEKQDILKFIHTFFLIKTQYEYQRASYNRLKLQPNNDYRVPLIFNPGEIVTLYTGVEIAKKTSKIKYFEYKTRHQQTCYELLHNYYQCY